MISWLSNIILPQKIGSYYISSYRVLGLEITPYALYGTLIVYSAKKIIIKKSIKELIEPYEEFDKTFQQAFDRLIKKIGSFDTLRISFSSAYSVLKEVRVPFSDPYKIKKIIRFEVEPYLPFGPSQAVINFIGLSYGAQESILMTASSSFDQVERYKQQLPQEWSDRAYLGIDMFDLYNLYTLSTALHRPGIVFFMYVGYSTTQIMCIVDNQLKLCRTLSEGIVNWATLMTAALGNDVQAALSSIMECGVQDTGKPGYLAAIQSTVHQSMKPILFTIESFMATLNQQEKNTQCYLAGPISSIVNVIPLIEQALKMPCRIYDISSAKNITLDTEVIPSSLLSLATALQANLNQEVNLNEAAEYNKAHKIMIRQVSTALILLVLGVLVSGWYALSIINTKKYRLQHIETYALKQLQSQQLTNKKRLTEALKDAADNVQTQEDIWSAFSVKKRVSFLYYLEQLSIVIDRVGLGLHMSRLLIDQAEATLSLSGYVKDFEALKKLETNLRQADIFMYVPSMQSVKFDIVLPLKKL